MDQRKSDYNGNHVHTATILQLYAGKAFFEHGYFALLLYRHRLHCFARFPFALFYCDLYRAFAFDNFSQKTHCHNTFNDNFYNKFHRYIYLGEKFRIRRIWWLFLGRFRKYKITHIIHSDANEPDTYLRQTTDSHEQWSGYNFSTTNPTWYREGLWLYNFNRRSAVWTDRRNRLYGKHL